MMPDDSSWAYLEGVTPAAKKEPTLFVVSPVGTATWRELLLAHMPFHHVRDKDRSRLLTEMRDLEHLFLRGHDTVLRAYYREAWLGITSAAPQPHQPMPGEETSDRDALRHVVHLQALLMVQAFETLRLDRYANAPPNRNWMNLFRRWGASWTFNYWFDELRDCFSKSFVHFYDDYIRYIGERIDELPLRHPWDKAATFERRVIRPADEAVHRGTRIRIDWEQGYPGVFLDSGILERHAESASADSIGPDEAPPKEGHAGEAPISPVTLSDTDAAPNS